MMDKRTIVNLSADERYGCQMTGSVNLGRGD